MLPKDPYILLSYINTQLRDEYASLDEFCDCRDEDKEMILSILSAAGFTYSPETNSFR